MPIIRLAEQEGWNKINEYLENYVPYGFEFTVGETEENLIDFSKFRDKKIKVWVNALWPHHNAKNHDDLALENPSIYQWYLDKKINIVQTDRPLELINFLKSKNKKFREDN